MRSKLLLSCLILSLASIAFAETLREEFDQTFDLRRGGRVILSNVNGSVTVESWDRNEVRVEAEKVVKARNRRIAEEVMQEVIIEIDHDRDFLEIKTRIPKRSGRFRDSFWGNGVNISVKYRLFVPRELSLEVSTVNGSVDVSEVSGNLRVSSTNGHVHVYEAAGTLDAKTTNGGIEAELLDIDHGEDMTFRTTNGGIKVYFPRDFSAYIDAKTTNGSIKTDFPIEFRGRFKRFKKNRLKGEINGGGGRISMSTTNGSIWILER